MGAEPSVQVRMPSIERALRAAGGTEVWLLLKGTEIPFDQFVGALDVVNEQWHQRSPEIGSFPSSSPVGHVVCVLDITGRAELASWIEAFGHELEQRGAHGTLTAAPQAFSPLWLNPSFPPELTAFTAWVVDIDSMTADPLPNAHWHVAPEATAAICSLASDWAIEPNAEVILRQNLFRLKVGSVDVAGPLGRSIQDTGMAGVEVVQESVRRCRYAALNPGGEGVFQVVDDDLDWEQRVQQLRPAVIGLPEHTNHTFIRSAPRGALSAMDLDRVVSLPGIVEGDVRTNKHLLHEYVPDAHGVQVLRDAHLHKAADLSRWNISELGHGRHLVEALDLEPWYSAAQPDPEVLARARKDFAPMLLTEEVIRRHPKT